MQVLEREETRHVHLLFVGRAMDVINRRYRTLAVIFLASFIFFTALTSFRRLWYDELFTYYVAKQAGLTGIWRALEMGADNHPFLTPLLTQWSMRLLADHPLFIRLPAILGFLLMSVSIYCFTRKRLPGGIALAAMVLPTVSDACRWGTEAKPYGLWFGFSALALVCWQRGTEGRKCGVALVGLSLSLALAFLTYAYAPLLLVALGAGELLRDWNRRRIDWAIWAALMLPLAATFSYVPLLRSLAGMVPIQDVPTWFSSPIDTYFNLLNRAVWVLAIGFLFALCISNRETDPYDRGLRPHELACVAVLALFPFFAVSVAKIFSGFYWPRHGYLCVIGLSILLAHLLGTRRPESGGLVAVLALSFYLWTCVTWFVGVFHPSRSMSVQASINDPSLLRGSLPPVPGDLPIVVSNGVEYFEFFHYAEPAVAPRLYFLTDRDTSRKYNHLDTPTVIYSNIKRWAGLPMQVVPYGEFLASHPHFYVYGAWVSREDWLLRKLAADGADLSVKGSYLSPRNDMHELLVEVRAQQLASTAH